MEEAVFLVVNLFTQMDPLDRGDIEDAIDEALAPQGLGEVTGGGGFIGKVESGPQCNIDLEVTDVAKAIPLIRQVLIQLQVDPRTEIVQFEPEEVRYPVYEN